MIACYPQVPTGYELGINCAVQSYCDKLCFGLTADAQVAPDVRRLRDFLHTSFRELCLAAGVKNAALRHRPARKDRPRRATAAKAAAPTLEPAEVPAPAPAEPAPVPQSMGAGAGQ